MHVLFMDQALSGVWNLLVGVLTWAVVLGAVWLVILAVIMWKKPELGLSILSAQLKIAWKMLSGTGRLLWKARKPLLVLGVFAALLLTTTTLLPSTRLQGDRHLVALVFSSTATAKTHGIPAEQAAQTLREVAKNRKTRGGKQE
ncbi:MAG: hypothetical protein ACTSP1_17750 [Candidatus Freyarchaeota archaeon]